VGFNLVLQVSKPYGFSFGSFSNSTTYRLNLKIESNLTKKITHFSRLKIVLKLINLLFLFITIFTFVSKGIFLR
jgi:hypothetical protein